MPRRQPTFPHEGGVLRALALRHPSLALDVLVSTRALARARSIRSITPAARAPTCSGPAGRAEPHAASAQGASPRSKWRGAHEAAVAHTMLLLGPSRASRRGVRARWLRVLALGNRGPPRARRGRRGHARSAAPTALCAEEGTRGAQRCSRRSVSERRLRAAGGRVPVCHGGSPPSLMKAGFFVHSPCATQVSHLMSSSAHVPSPALAASAASHQPHARRHVAALPAERNHTRRQRRAPHRAASGAAHMKRRLRTQCSSLAHPAHFSSSTHGAARPSRQRSHESGHSSRMKAWLSWHCPLLIQYSQSAEASEHRPVMTISSPARTAWKMSRLEFSLMCLPADRGRDARSTHPCSHNQLRGNSGG